MTELTDFRTSKDEYMGHEHHSPLTHEQLESFSGLSYYDESSDLKLELKVEEFEDREVVEMQTSTGDVASYVRLGRIHFGVDGEDFFLPFADATSGDETYGAGRYLDVHALPGGKVLVDFNYAYNPYCAYNEAWSCPITPFENRLRVPIRAGEKNFK